MEPGDDGVVLLVFGGVLGVALAESDGLLAGRGAVVLRPEFVVEFLECAQAFRTDAAFQKQLGQRDTVVGAPGFESNDEWDADRVILPVGARNPTFASRLVGSDIGRFAVEFSRYARYITARVDQG